MNEIKKIFFSFKSSAKSVILNYREYVGIYIAVLIVQLLLGVWTMSAYTNYSSNNELFENNYGYDIIITKSKYELSDLEGVFRADNKIVTDFGMVGDKLGVSIKSGTLEEFKSAYLTNNKAEYTVTPFYAYHTEMQSEIILSSVIIGAITMCIAALILSVIHSVRTNQYRFQYGIYMTFGADKKMLCKLVAEELFTINTLLLIPSAVISYLLLLIIYAPKGVTVLFTPLQILAYILLSYLAVVIASGSSIGGLFFKPPIALITAADNSHFVTSPRRSFNIFAKKIPTRYEGYTIWRFRKYIARLIAGAVAFSVIFVTVIYAANMLQAEQNAPIMEYSFKFKNSTYAEAQREKANSEGRNIIDALYEIPGIERLDFEQNKSFTYLNDHIILKSENVEKGNSITVTTSEYRDSDFTTATNNCRYVCIDPLTLRNYERSYSVEYMNGINADNLSENKDLIVISEGLFGVKNFDFKPGDKIVLADMIRTASIPISTDPLELLRLQILNYGFEYRELTIGAVIHDTSADSNIIIGVNEEAYLGFTRDKRVISGIDVYFENETDLNAISAAHSSIEGLMSGYSEWEITAHDAAIAAYVNDVTDIPALLYLLAALVLVICPLIWIFSQSMFFKKREPELRTLSHIGVTEKEILGIHLVSGMLIFVLGFIFNFAVSRLVCYVIYRILTAYLPRLGFVGMNVSFDSFVPLSVMIICAAVSAACGLVSSLIPFLVLKRKIKRERESVEHLNF